MRAGRHKGLSTIYIKRNLFHQSRLGRDIELQITHIVLFNSPRDVLQINTLSQQLGLGSQLKDTIKRSQLKDIQKLLQPRMVVYPLI